MPTEKEKMLAGELYDATDPVLMGERQKARLLIQRFNATAYSDREAYQQVIRELLPNAAPDIAVEAPFYCDYGYNIYAGEKVFFNFDCVLLDVMPIYIGAFTMFGPKVQIYTATHPLEAAERRKGPEFARPISIGADCWIGGGVIISPGVKIGDRCVIGAGAVVTKDIPADTIAVGNPARPLTSQKS